MGYLAVARVFFISFMAVCHAWPERNKRIFLKKKEVLSSCVELEGYPNDDQSLRPEPEKSN